jgi:hypothetical protein
MKPSTPIASSIPLGRDPDPTRSLAPSLLRVGSRVASLGNADVNGGQVMLRIEGSQSRTRRPIDVVQIASSARSRAISSGRSESVARIVRAGRGNGCGGLASPSRSATRVTEPRAPSGNVARLARENGDRGKIGEIGTGPTGTRRRGRRRAPCRGRGRRSSRRRAQSSSRR